MSKADPNNGNETKSDFFHGTYSNLTSFFVGSKILKNLIGFHNENLSVSLQKPAQTSKMK